MVPLALADRDLPIPVGIDTMSSVNTCLRTAGGNLRRCTPVLVDGLGGPIEFDAIVDLPVACKDGKFESVECFAADACHLPPNTDAILGLPAISQLDISVDKCLADRRRVIFAPASDDFAKRQTAWNRLLTVLMLCFATIASAS